jgi:hypothetical protein
LAFAAATPYSSISVSICSSVSGLGVSCGCFLKSAPHTPSCFGSMGTSLAETTGPPSGMYVECPARPMYHSWHAIVPPSACTASTTFFHPATCSRV